MKKTLLTAITAVLICILYSDIVNAAETATPEPVIKIEIPASEVDKIDVKYESQSNTSKALEETKAVTQKAVTGTKEFTEKTVTGTKKVAKKSAETTKQTTNKAVKATKETTSKAVTATKNAAQKTVDNTKDVIDNINPNKPVTKAGLEADANIKTLKNEKKELKSAYNSRIKDVDAKINAVQNYSDLTEVQKQNKVYSLQKEKAALEKEKDEYMEKYDTKIETAKTKKRNAAK